MYTGVVPVLTKGSFATFFGGQDVIQEIEKDKDNSSPSNVIPLFFIFSSLFQMLIYLHKRIRSSSARNIHSYISLLKNSLGECLSVGGACPLMFPFFSRERAQPVRPRDSDCHFWSLLLRSPLPHHRHPGWSLQPAASGDTPLPPHSPEGVLRLLFADDCHYNSSFRKKSSIKVRVQIERHKKL